jgi:crossover junction endodeoxyribonuclease RuvC
VSLRATGLVVLSDGGDVLRTERIGWPASKWPCTSLASRISYFAHVSKAIRACVSEAAALAPVRVAVEDYAVHGPGDPTLAPELGGIVRLGLQAFDVVEVAPSALKAFATGKGNAPKPVVMLEVFKRWAFDPGQDDNIADAYVLARMVRAATLGDETLTKVQRETLQRSGLEPRGTNARR